MAETVPKSLRNEGTQVVVFARSAIGIPGVVETSVFGTRRRQLDGWLHAVSGR